MKLAGVLQAAVVAAILLTLMARAACNKPVVNRRDDARPEHHPVP